MIDIEQPNYSVGLEMATSLTQISPNIWSIGAFRYVCSQNQPKNQGNLFDLRQKTRNWVDFMHQLCICDCHIAFDHHRQLNTNIIS